MKQYLAAAGLLAVVVLIAVIANMALTPASSSSAERPTLRVSAGRSFSAFMFTNREDQAISDCRIALLEGGQENWRAELSNTVQPSETVNVPWSFFLSNGHPVPEYIATTAKNFTVDCEVNLGRLSVGVHFDQ